MNYEAYFANAKHNRVSFTKAWEMLAVLLSVTTAAETKMLWDEIEQYAY